MNLVFRLITNYNEHVAIIVELCKTYTTKKLKLNNLRPCNLKYFSGSVARKLYFYCSMQT